MNGRTTNTTRIVETGSRTKARRNGPNQRSARSRLVALLHHQQALLDTVADAAWLKDLKSRFLVVNRAFAAGFGKRPEELIGKTDDDIVSKDLADRRREEDRVTIALGREYRTEEASVDRDGRPVRVETVRSPVFDGKGKIIGIAALVRPLPAEGEQEGSPEEGREDLDRMAAINRRLEARIDELQQANDDLRTLIYSVSHDLRAPITATQSLLGRLVDKHGYLLDERGRHLLSLTTRSVRQVEDLVRGLLAFFNLRHDAIRHDSIDMEALVKDIFEELNVVNSDIALQLDVKSLPPVWGDEKMMRQVLVNLMGNAVKFSKPKGKVLIQVGSRTEGESVTYYVKDNGIGFPAHHASRVFKIFERLRSHDEFEGSGIGLAIVEHAITRHGGTVWAEGIVDEGATFYFSLPRGPHDASEGTTNPERSL